MATAVSSLPNKPMEPTAPAARRLIGRALDEGDPMAKVLPTDHTERLGIAEFEKICAQAAQIFRELHLRDVGIDGFIELVLDGQATGLLVGVQVKSGDSFVRNGGTTFCLQADRRHLIYWAGCMFPVIGVVHEPSSGKTVWMDITAICTEERIDNGPFLLSCVFGPDTTLTADTLVGKLVPAALHHLEDLGRRQRVRDVVKGCKERWSARLPAPQAPATQEDRVAAWRELVEFLLSPSTSVPEAADAAYRLSWYLPAVDDERTKILDEALALSTEHDLRRLLQAADHAEEIDGQYASHCAAVISYIPHAVQKIESMLAARHLSAELKSVAIRVIEFIEQDERDDLRKKYMVVKQSNGSDGPPVRSSSPSR